MLIIEDLVLAVGASGNEDVILRGVNLTIDQGRCVLILAEPGGGKTSLAKLLCGLSPPRFGRLSTLGTLVAGTEVEAADTFEQRATSPELLVIDDADRLPLELLTATLRRRRERVLTTLLLSHERLAIDCDQILILRRGALEGEDAYA